MKNKKKIPKNFFTKNPKKNLTKKNTKKNEKKIFLKKSQKNKKNFTKLTKTFKN